MYFRYCFFFTIVDVMHFLIEFSWWKPFNVTNQYLQGSQKFKTHKMLKRKPTRPSKAKEERGLLILLIACARKHENTKNGDSRRISSPTALGNHCEKNTPFLKWFRERSDTCLWQPKPFPVSSLSPPQGCNLDFHVWGAPLTLHLQAKAEYLPILISFFSYFLLLYLLCKKLFCAGKQLKNYNKCYHFLVFQVMNSQC